MKPIWMTLLLFTVYTTIFGVGCWEANLAVHHVPTAKSSPGYIHGYVYTIFACVTNITGIPALLCILGFKNTKTNENTSPLPISCVIAIWAIILFAGMINDDIRTGPFQPVVIAQFAIAMTGFSLCCCCVLGLSDPDPREIPIAIPREFPIAISHEIPTAVQHDIPTAVQHDITTAVQV